MSIKLFIFLFMTFGIISNVSAQADQDSSFQQQDDKGQTSSDTTERQADAGGFAGSKAYIELIDRILYANGQERKQLMDALRMKVTDGHKNFQKHGSPTEGGTTIHIIDGAVVGDINQVGENNDVDIEGGESRGNGKNSIVVNQSGNNNRVKIRTGGNQ